MRLYGPLFSNFGGTKDVVVNVALMQVLAAVHTVAILCAVKKGLGRHLVDVLEDEGPGALRRMSKVSARYFYN